MYSVLLVASTLLPINSTASALPCSMIRYAYDENRRYEFYLNHNSRVLLERPAPVRETNPQARAAVLGLCTNLPVTTI